MSYVRRPPEVVKDLSLSLEALSTMGKLKAKDRPLNEALSDWQDKPIKASRALLETLKPKGDE